MNQQLKLYKTLGNPASLYVEVNDLSAPFTIDIYLDAQPFLTFDNHKHHMLALSKSGTYTATVKAASLPIIASNKVCVYDSDIQLPQQDESAEASGASQLKIRELVIDERYDYFLEIKIKKGNASRVKAELSALAGIEKMQKKELRLDSFPSTHSIHDYEYYLIDSLASRASAIELCERLESLEYVIYCSMTPDTRNLPPPDLNIDVLPEAKSEPHSTPDFSPLQTYLDAPHGMNVRSAWALGNTGIGATIRHLDFGIYKDHEDFQGGNITVVSSRDESQDCNHGTASTGCIAGANSGFGITGIAYSASFFFYDTGYLQKIMEDALPGDIVSLDIQFGFTAGYLPAVMVKSWWDAIKNMTENNVIVIMAAGNSGLNLSDSRFPNYGNSGGLVVGACS